MTIHADLSSNLGTQWGGGKIIPPELALTGTTRREGTLRKVSCDVDCGVANINEPLGPSRLVIAQQGVSATTSLPQPVSRCVYNYEDKYRFRRIITGTDLLFSSHFESGNLMAAYRRELPSSKTSFAEYDLILHHDVHSVGHTQWFYFSVSNTISGMTVKFNIGNFSKRSSLFNQVKFPG